MNTIVSTPSTPSATFLGTLRLDVGFQIEEAIRSVGAPERHRARVAATVSAADSAPLPSVVSDAAWQPRVIAAITWLLADMCGHGGSRSARVARAARMMSDVMFGQFPGMGRVVDSVNIPFASQRLAPFSNLGSGRYQATDGGAYFGAAQAALWELLNRAAALAENCEYWCDVTPANQREIWQQEVAHMAAGLADEREGNEREAFVTLCAGILAALDASLRVI